jgi:hypothetical protein
MSAADAMKEREPLHTYGENINCWSHYEKGYGDYSKKLKIELSYCYWGKTSSSTCFKKSPIMEAT